MLNYLTEEEKDRLYTACPDIYEKLFSIARINRILVNGSTENLEIACSYMEHLMPDTAKKPTRQRKARRKESANET